MAITYSAGAAAAIAQKIQDMYEGAGSQIEFQNASSEELSTIVTLDWDAGLNGTVINPIPAGGGTCTKAVITMNTAEGNHTATVSVSTSGADINLNKVLWVADESIAIDPEAAPFTQPLS